MTNYKSQIGQDKYISEHIFNNKKNGFFIELGATDGIAFSNTYYFEKELGWNGLVIEPNPNYKELLENNRNCHKAYELVYSKRGLNRNFSIVSYPELSGINNHLGSIGKCEIVETINLKTITLTELLDNINAPNYIDYLSLDTEGTELEILKGLNMKKYTIGYISVEHNYGPLREEIKNYLLSRNYFYSRWNKFDDEYIHNDLAKIYMWSDEKTVMTPKSD